MNNLTKNKRNRLIGVVLATVLVMSGLWFGLISFQQQRLAAIAGRRTVAERQRDVMEQTIRNASRIEADLVESGKQLSTLEGGMASGDLYSWVINTIRQFKTPYKVEVPQFSQIDGPRDMSMIPSFPYQQATLTVGGTAFFHDLGRFIADFENQFPYFRVLNLNLEPFAAVGQGDHEKLSFKMDIAVLVKPSAS
jgi:hypothetical protein